MSKLVKSVIIRIIVGMALLFLPLLLPDVLNDEQSHDKIPKYIAFYSVVVVICAIASAWVKESLKDRPYTNLFDEALIIPLICTFAALIHVLIESEEQDPLATFGWVIIVAIYSFHIAIGVFIKNLVLILWNAGKPKLEEEKTIDSKDTSNEGEKRILKRKKLMNKTLESLLMRIILGAVFLFIPVLPEFFSDEPNASDNIISHIRFYLPVALLCVAISAIVKCVLRNRPFLNLFCEPSVIPLICIPAAYLHVIIEVPGEDPLVFIWVFIVARYSGLIAIGVFIKNLVLILWNAGKKKHEEQLQAESKDSSKGDENNS